MRKSINRKLVTQVTEEEQKGNDERYAIPKKSVFWLPIGAYE